jgi:S1-C subfamily serine protease
VPFGSQDQVACVAINLFGLGGSVTVGIISAKRASTPVDDYPDDAAKQGRSRRPLFNMEAR